MCEQAKVGPATAAPPIVATVIVSTRNRCRDLARCLAGLQDMGGVGGDWEIVVVNNNSTDATPGVVHEFAVNCMVPVRYLFEGRRGKSAALNTAIAEARGAILAFTDDDCLPDRFWLRNVLAEFEADPDLAVLGGRVELYDQRDQDISIIRCNHRADITPDRIFRALFGSSTDMETYGSVIGANMAVRRETFAKVGLFDVFLAPGSTRLALSSEDSDFAYRACRAGLKVAYSPEPLIHHNHGRRTEVQVNAVIQCYNRGRGAFYFKYLLSGDIRVVKAAYWELSGYWKSLWSRRLDPAKRRRIGEIARALFDGMSTQLVFIGRIRTGKVPV